MTYKYISETGVIVPDTETLLADVTREWQDAFGAINTDPATPQGVMIAAEVINRENVANNNAALANQINPNIARGVFLDAICALMGIERHVATSSEVAGVNLAGVPGTNIPAGTLAKDTEGHMWALKVAVTLPTSSSVWVCTDTGPVPLLAGALNEIVTPVLGFETIYNAAAAQVIGTSQETYYELRNRRKVTLAKQGISTDEAQLSGVFDIPGVTSAVFRENTSNTNATIDGVDMVAHSIWLCADGGDSFEIAKTMQRNKTDGAGYNGAIEIPVTNSHSGQTVTVKFDRPAHIPVSVSIVGRVNGDKSVNPQVVIPQAVADWAAGKVDGDPGLTIGTAVSVFEIGGAVNIAVPGFQVTQVVLSSGGVPQPGNIAISLKQRAIIGVSDVSVVVLP